MVFRVESHNKVQVLYRISPGALLFFLQTTGVEGYDDTKTDNSLHF